MFNWGFTATRQLHSKHMKLKNLVYIMQRENFKIAHKAKKNIWTCFQVSPDSSSQCKIKYVWPSYPTKGWGLWNKQTRGFKLWSCFYSKPDARTLSTNLSHLRNTGGRYSLCIEPRELRYHDSITRIYEAYGQMEVVKYCPIRLPAELEVVICGPIRNSLSLTPNSQPSLPTCTIGVSWQGATAGEGPSQLVSVSRSI